MDYKKLFAKYHTRLMWEGIIKAALCGLAVGALLSAIPALILLALTPQQAVSPVLVSLIVLAGGTVAAAPLFYFTLFKPTIKAIAHRVDRLGLEERIITMMEFEKDETYIAMAQREDTSNSLAKTSSKKLKFSWFAMVPIIIALVVGVSLSATTIPVSEAASNLNKLEWSQYDYEGRSLNLSGSTSEAELLAVDFGVRLLIDIVPEEVTVDVSMFNIGRDTITGTIPMFVFDYGLGGSIIGHQNQIVEHGSNASPVVAVPGPEYVFHGFFVWGYQTFRAEVDDHIIEVQIKTFVPAQDHPLGEHHFTLTGVTQHMDIFAVFRLPGEGESASGDGEPGDGEPGDGEDDAPGELGENVAEGDGPPGEPPPFDEDAPGGEGALDPYTYCVDTIRGGDRISDADIDAAIYQAMALLAANQPIPPSLRRLLERYARGLI